MLLVNSRPPGLRYLYAAVAGHAFAWYTLYNLFVMWLVSRGHSQAAATSSYGNLVAAAYLLPLLGGLLTSGASLKLPALRWEEQGYDLSQGGFKVVDTYLVLHWKTTTLPALGPRRTALIGGVLAIVGYTAVTVAAKYPAFTVPAVALVALGVGLSKPNISAMVGRLFPSGSPLADAAFARYYSYINVGAVASPIIGGSLAESFGYGAAFAFAILGEVVVVASLLLGRQHLAITEQQSSLVAAVGEVEVDGVVAAPSLGRLQDDHVGVDADPATAKEMAALKQRKLTALWIFFAFAALAFWPAYAQNGSGLNLWALEHTDRLVLGHNVPPTWFAAINSVVCIVAAVPLIRFFSKVSLSTSSSIGYALMASSFGVLAAAPSTNASPWWLIASITLSSLSEVLISTIGLAQVAKLAPRHQASTYMAMWFLTVAVGGKLAGLYGGLRLYDCFVVLAAVASVAAGLTLALRSRLDVAGNAVETSSGRRGGCDIAVTAASPVAQMVQSNA